jgi:hypothetical protein
MPSNISPWSEPSRRRRIALHEPAISTAMLTVSMRPTVVTLCGIVTKAPRIFPSRNNGRRKAA